MKTLTKKKDFIRPPKEGDIVKGKLVWKGRSSLFFDLQNFKIGVVYGRELLEAKDMLKELKPGTEIPVKIIELDNEDGYVELSIRGAREELVWTELKEKKEKGETFTVKILGVNRGGLLSRVSGVPAFLPFSYLLPEHYSNIKKLDISKDLKEFQKMMGKELKVKIAKLDYRTGTVILSEKT